MRGLLQNVLRNVVFSLTVLAAVYVGKAFVSESAGFAVVWPAAGLLFAALVHSPPGRWPGLMVGAFSANALGNLWLGLPWAVNVGLCAANTLESVVAAIILLKLFRVRPSLERLNQVFGLIVAAVAAAAASATLAAAVLRLAGDAPTSLVWTAWFVADFLGILLAGGLLCAWLHRRPVEPAPLGVSLLRVGVSAAMLALTIWVFQSVSPHQVWAFRRPWMLVVVGQLLALTCPPHLTLLTLFVSSAAAVVLTRLGQGPFTMYTSESSARLLDLQAFLALLAMINLAFSAANYERQRSLARKEHQLRRITSQRERAAAVAALMREQSRELRLAKEAAESASSAKTTFLANMSHEIRTPLTSILGFSELLLEQELSSDSCEAVKTIQRNGDHLLALLNDLLDLSKIECGMLQLECRPVDLRSLMQDVERMVRPQAESKSLTLGAAVAPGVPTIIDSDPLRLRQSFLNLASNAVKFTAVGHVQLALEPTAEHDQRNLCFRVTDTGIGISAQQLDRVFEPFVQADASTTRKYGGSGLGLAITKRIAEALGGGLTVASRPGRGTTFRFVFAAPTTSSREASPVSRRERSWA